MNPQEKINPDHLRRKACLYIRQSSLYQTEHNQESTRRQYDFQGRARALGWSAERIEIIDEDQGLSGAGAVARPGFERLAAEVGLGQVGLVLCLEVSRLARNSTQWHRLLELCALSETLLMDEDAIYDPNNFNDRLILGLRGTMSEAELHFLKARMQGGKLNKARRGELKHVLPSGFVYDAADKVVLDPDRQVREAIGQIFSVFEQTRSAWRTVRQLDQAGIQIPVRLRLQSRVGEILWSHPTLSIILNKLKNPAYAGVYFFGRTRQRPGVRYAVLPIEQWKVFLPDAHPGYITWEQYQRNREVLAENSVRFRSKQGPTPPREGPALLQGQALCGKCGRRMTLRYESSVNTTTPTYVCQHLAKEHARKYCQVIPGRGVDRAIAQAVIRAMTPEAAQAALGVFDELRRRHAEVDAMHQTQVERARQEARLAERQFLLTSPDNRLVAETLEKRWNDKLRALTAAEEAYTSWKQTSVEPMAEGTRARVLELAQDFEAIWNHPQTTARERKRMLRLLIEDVTLTRGEDICVQIRWRGGATEQLHLPPPKIGTEARPPSSALIAAVAALAPTQPDERIAEILNERGWTSPTGKALNFAVISRIRRPHGIPGCQERMRASGLLSPRALMLQYGISSRTVQRWEEADWIKPVHYGKRVVYRDPGGPAPRQEGGEKNANSALLKPKSEASRTGGEA